MLVGITEDLFVNPWKVTVVKAAGEGKCVLYVSGQSALDGFVVNRDALEVATDILEAMEEDGEPEEEADGEETTADDSDRVDEE